jgi:DNA-binding NtrC family response regulator
MTSAASFLTNEVPSIPSTNDPGDPRRSGRAPAGDDAGTRRVTGLEVLLVEDEPVLAKNLRRSLERAGHVVEAVESGEAALEHARVARPDVVLLDNRLPGMSGIETLRALREHDPSIVVILMTAFATLEDAINAMRLGAADFVRKPVGLADLELAIQRAVKNERLQQELHYYRGQHDGRGQGDLIGSSEAMSQLQRTLARLASIAPGRGPTILITGETGTGKGLIARLLHRTSARASGPFIDVNCTAIPESLLEAELFGYEKGAFTDARSAKPGLIEAAEGGTLFLDEIGHVSGAVQAKLLKVIEERTVRRLGSVRDRVTDVWVIAATNRNLEQSVRSGEFREDLYHRLRVLEIAVPPLRERGDDVVELATHFLRAHATRYGMPVPRLSDAAIETLRRYRWPGNVRELANVLERALIMGEESVLEPGDLAIAATTEGGAGEFRVVFPPGGIVWADLEKSLIEQALAQSGGNQVRAAKLLGLSRDALRYRMEKHGVRS